MISTAKAVMTLKKILLEEPLTVVPEQLPVTFALQPGKVPRLLSFHDVIAAGVQGP